MKARSPLGLLLLALAVGSCGGTSDDDSAPASCTEAPSKCPAGTVCWLDDGVAGTYSCQPARAGATQGASCQNLVKQPTCAEGLACFPSDTLGNGVCEPFCSVTSPTPGQCAPPSSGGQCVELRLETNPKYPVYVCSAPSSGSSGGTDGGTD